MAIRHSASVGASTHIRAVAIAVIAALGLAVTSAAAAIAPSNIVGNVRLSGVAAHDGCVVLYDSEFEELDESCPTNEYGTFDFGDVPDGTYYVFFEGFTGAANTWWPVGSMEPTPIVVVGNEEHALNVSLETGGTISGSSTVGDYARLWTLDGYEVQSASYDGEGDYQFTHVPAGTYRVSVHSDETGTDQFYRDSLLVTPTEYDFPAAGNDWALDIGAYTTVRSNVGAVGGELNGPKTFTSSTLCAVAADPDTYAVISVFCGPRGSMFELEGVPVEERFILAITNGDNARTGNWYKSSNTRWFGNVTWDIAPQIYLELPREDWFWLPVFYFKDVDAFNSLFFEIQWMGATGLSVGYSDGTYKPKLNVTRGQMATFLYRYAGSPEIELPSTSPFKDITTSSSLYPAAVWMKQQGITTVATYNPNGSVTRREMSMFLYRMAGSPAVTLPSKNPFSDVSKSDSGYKAMVWMKQEGLTTVTKFQPKSAVARSAMAAFIYRFDQIG